LSRLFVRPDLAVLSAVALFQGAAGDEWMSSSRLRTEHAEIARVLETLPDWVPNEQRNGRIGFHGRALPAQWIVIDLGETVAPEEVVLFPARLPIDAGTDNEGGFPPEIEVEIAAEESFENAVRLGRWEEEVEGGGVRLPMLRIMADPGEDLSGRFLRIRVFGSRPRRSGRGAFYSLGEILVLAGGRNAALHRPVTTSGSLENPPRWRAENLTDGYLWCLPGQGIRSSPSNGYHSAIEADPDQEKWVEIDLGELHSIDELHLVPAHPQDFSDTAGFGFPPQFRVLGVGADGRERVLFASGAAGFANPGASTVMLPVGGTPLRRVRIECPQLWERSGDFLFALGELQTWSMGENVAQGKPVQARDEVETGIWLTEALVDGFSSRHELLSWKEWLDGLCRRAELGERSRQITAILDQRAEEARRLWIAGGMAGVSVMVLGFLLALSLQRRQAAQSREALRQRIAHDLHDELGASLSHLALQSDLARRQLSEDDPVRDRLTGLSQSARSTLDDMRDAIWLLAPATDSWDGFQKRLESISERLLDGMDHAFRVAGEVPAGSPPIQWTREAVLFFKEAVTNARRHAEASWIEATLVWSGAKVLLLVRDDGRGFDPDDPNRSEGLGLRSLSSRAAALGGRLEVKSQPGAGTLIRLEAPLPRKNKP